jgi:hypothetical protein
LLKFSHSSEGILWGKLTKFQKILLMANHKHQIGVSQDQTGGSLSRIRANQQMASLTHTQESWWKCRITQTHSLEIHKKDWVLLYSINLTLLDRKTSLLEVHMNSITVPYIMVNGLKMAWERVKASSCGKTVANTKVTGKTTEQMVMGD